MVESGAMPGWHEDDLIMISALEHYSYCPRQCALIHVEQTYEENLYTLRGNRVHRRVDQPVHEKRGSLRIERALPLYSERLGLVGKADVVEFHGKTPYPVEYKQGKKRKHTHAEIQLCAQALCLEEMTGEEVSAGAIFHASSQRRDEIHFSSGLRRKVERMVEEVRAMIDTQAVPPPVNDARCRHCSLREACMPDVIDDWSRSSKWHQRLYQISPD